jgi:hypothetical protein
VGITPALLEDVYRVIAISRTISKSKDLKPSADFVLVDGDIGKNETAIKVADAAVRHFDRIDLLQPKPIIERCLRPSFSIWAWKLSHPRAADPRQRLFTWQQSDLQEKLGSVGMKTTGQGFPGFKNRE